MPVSLEYLKDEGVVFKGSRVMTGHETIVLNKQLAEEIQKGRSIKYQIVNLLEVEKFDVSSSDIKTLAAQDAEVIAMNPGMLIAIVVSDSVAFGMNRMYSAYLEMSTESESVHIFSSLDEACQWIYAHISPGRNLAG